MPGEFRISHAWIQLEGLGEHGSPEYFRSALDQSWVAGAQVTRYTRTWRLSRQTEPGEGLRAGHLGFVEEGELSTLHWDETGKDFIRGEASSGVVIPFLIDDIPRMGDTRRLISFQLLPGAVRPMTVASNLQALLNTKKTHIWKITPISVQKSFDQWVSTVEGVATFNVRLTYPNPNWTGRENVEGLVEGLKAETVTIRAKAIEGSSIDIHSDWFRQAMDHVRQGYGKATLTGTDLDTGSSSQFVETINGGSVPIIDRIRSSHESLEVTTEDLRQSQDQLIETRSQDMVIVEADEESEL